MPWLRADAAAAAFRTWSRTTPTARGEPISRAADLVKSRADDLCRPDDAGDGSVAGLVAVQRPADRKHHAGGRGSHDGFAGRCLRPTSRTVFRWLCANRSASASPSRHGMRRSSWACASMISAPGLRQHRCTQGLRTLPGNPSVARRTADHWRASPRGTVNVVMNAPQDAASIVSTLIGQGGAPCQFHRLEPHRSHHRRGGRTSPEAGSARARRHGAAARARRCGSGCRRAGLRIRRLHASRTDLHVHRTRHRRSPRGR